MNFDPIVCGMRIRILRKSEKLNQIQTADRLNISATHLRALEAGRRGASIDLMVEIAKLFHVSLDYLILGQIPSFNTLRIDLRVIISQLEKQL